jgi:hypothetical protein
LTETLENVTWQQLFVADEVDFDIPEAELDKNSLSNEQQQVKPGLSISSTRHHRTD